MARILTAAFCVLVIPAPAFADTVRINQVVQTLTSSKGTPNLKLNTLVSQDPAPKQDGPRSETPATKSDPITSSVLVTGEGQQLGVEIVEEGEIEGTICDCGEILIAAADFPKWPFLFLAAVPLVFISDCDGCKEPPNSSPSPNPPSSPPNSTPKPTPEPASLLLFGTGLLAAGAGFRRRHTKAKLAQQIKVQEDE